MTYDLTADELRALADLMDALPPDLPNNPAWDKFDGDVLLGDVPVVLAGGEVIGWFVWVDEVDPGKWGFRYAGGGRQ